MGSKTGCSKPSPPVLCLAFCAWARTPLKRSESPVAGVPVLTIVEHYKRTNALFVRIMVPIAGAWAVTITLFGTGMTALD
jgi:hypothetical protein